MPQQMNALRNLFLFWIYLILYHHNSQGNVTVLQYHYIWSGVHNLSPWERQANPDELIMQLIIKPAWRMWMSTVCLDHYSQCAVIFDGHGHWWNNCLIIPGTEWVGRAQASRSIIKVSIFEHGSLGPCYSCCHGLLSRHARGKHLVFSCASVCRLVSRSTRKRCSALGHRAIQLHSDHLHCETHRISLKTMWGRQSLPPSAGLLSRPLVAAQATAQTTPALPKLPSAAACACLSHRNILSAFGQAWKDGKLDRKGEKGGERHKFTGRKKMRAGITGSRKSRGGKESIRRLASASWTGETN